MARKTPEKEGHKMPESYIDDNLDPTEDKTKVREIADDDGNLLGDDELFEEDNEEDMKGAGSGDPSVDHPEPESVKAGSKKYTHPSVVEEKTPDKITDHPEPGIEDDEFSDDDDGEDTDEDDEEGTVPAPDDEEEEAPPPVKGPKPKK